MGRVMKKKLKGKICLDVGCGFNPAPGFIGMDKREVKGVDIVHDCEVFPWPISDNECERIVMSHIVEHIKPWLTIDFMNEAWRVMKPNGYLEITTPYGTSFGYIQDPTHCNPWNEATVSYFVKGEPMYEIYRPKPWKGINTMYAHMGNMQILLQKDAEDE